MIISDWVSKLEIICSFDYVWLGFQIRNNLWIYLSFSKTRSALNWLEYQINLAWDRCRDRTFWAQIELKTDNVLVHTFGFIYLKEWRYKQMILNFFRINSSHSQGDCSHITLIYVRLFHYFVNCPMEMRIPSFFLKTQCLLPSLWVKPKLVLIFTWMAFSVGLSPLKISNLGWCRILMLLS